MRSPTPVLPRPTHASLRDEVATTARGRMLVGLCDVVAEKGYAAATVADIVRVAPVSRRTFYQHFPDKETCFLAAYDHGAAAMSEAVANAAREAGDDWRAAAAASLTTYLELLAQEPGFARAFLVEIWAAGPPALRRHRKVIARFERQMGDLHARAAREQALAPVTPVQLAAVTGGIARVATTAILEGKARQLPAKADELLEFALAVIARPRQA